MNLDSACSTLLPLDFLKNNPDARFSRLYFCHSLNRLQRGLSAIAELLVDIRNENKMSHGVAIHMVVSKHVSLKHHQVKRHVYIPFLFESVLDDNRHYFSVQSSPTNLVQSKLPFVQSKTRNCAVQKS